MLFGSFSIRRNTSLPIFLSVDSERLYLCQTTLSIIPTVLFGDPTKHNFVWEATGGAPVNILSDIHELNLIFEYATQNRRDAFFRLTVDGRQTYNVIASGTPRSLLALKPSTSTYKTDQQSAPGVQFFSIQYDTSQTPYGITDQLSGFTMVLNRPVNLLHYNNTFVEKWNVSSLQWELVDILYASPDQSSNVLPNSLYRLGTQYTVTPTLTTTYTGDFFKTPPTPSNARFAWSTFNSPTTSVTSTTLVINIPSFIRLYPTSTLNVITGQNTYTTSTVSSFTFQGPNIDILNLTTSTTTSFSVTYFGNTTIGG